MADVPVLYRIFVLPCKRCKTSSRARKLFIHSFYSYSVPAVHRRDRYAGMVQLQHQLPKRALPHLVIRTSFHHFAVTSNLLHWTVWLLSTIIYIGVSRSALLHPLTVYQAFWLLLLLAISCPRTFSLLQMLHSASLCCIATPEVPKERHLFHKSIAFVANFGSVKIALSASSSAI